MKGATELDLKTKEIIRIKPINRPLIKLFLFWKKGAKNFSDRSSVKEIVSAHNNKRASLIAKVPPERLIIELRRCKALEISEFRKKIHAKNTATCVKSHPK